MRVFASAFVCGTALVLSALSATAQTPAEFYRDKQIKFVVSSSVGGGFDTYTRLIARHIQKHMAGGPAFVVQNMAGAGGVRAANFLYTVAPKDGTTIALFQNSVPFEPLYGNKQAPLRCQYSAVAGIAESGVCGVRDLAHGAGRQDRRRQDA